MNVDRMLLDIQVAGGVAPGARLAMYFTEFTEQGWVDAIVAAATDTTNNPSIISISYGNPEDAAGSSLWTRDAIPKANEAFQTAALRHMTICCASGDDGSSDQVSDGPSYSAGPGYDACAGLGSPDGTSLRLALQQLSAQPPAQVLAAVAAAPPSPGAAVVDAVNRLLLALKQAGIPIG